MIALWYKFKRTVQVKNEISITTMWVEALVTFSDPHDPSGVSKKEQIPGPRPAIKLLPAREVRRRYSPE